MIGKIKNYCYRILPLVYDQTLSYYETLCKVVDKINEVIDFVDNSLKTEIQAIVSKLVIDTAYDAETETLTILLDTDTDEG